MPKRGQHSQKNCEIVDDSAQTRTALVGQPKKHRFAHHSIIQHFQFLPILQTTNSPDHIHQHRTDFPKFISYTNRNNDPIDGCILAVVPSQTPPFIVISARLARSLRSMSMRRKTNRSATASWPNLVHRRSMPSHHKASTLELARRTATDLGAHPGVRLSTVDGTEATLTRLLIRRIR